MKYKLCKYQEESVVNLISYSKKLINSEEKDKYILLKAITGAGKTVIAGAYMEEMFKEFDNLAFIWISVGKGGLHLQSRSSLVDKLSSSISVKLIDDALRDECLHHKDILVLNWENLNTTKIDSITKERYFDNVIMRDGEQRNFKELCFKTIENNTKIILIIDESHNTSGSKTSKDIVELINPVFTLEITATPHEKRIPNQEDGLKHKAFYEGVKTIDVINEGTIKKSIVLNDVSKEYIKTNSTVEFIINQAMIKQNELRKAYIEEGENINPLCLIQLPDGNEGNTLKEEVLDILNHYGYSKTNDKVAIWLSGEKTHDDFLIKSMKSPIDFLIFKQAVATGWDCPRASVLVKLRDTKSTIFDLQTIGRIIRMPKRKHYNNEILNNGYVFTNSEYSINTGDYDQVLPIRQVLKKEFREEILKMHFNCEKIKVSQNSVDTKILEISFREKISKQSLNMNFNELVLNIKKSETKVSDFDKVQKTEIESRIIDEQKIQLTKYDINKEFEKMIKGISNNQYPYKNLTNIVKKVLSEYNDLNKCSYSDLKQVALLNKDIIIQCFNEIKNENKCKIQSTSYSKVFSFGEDRHASEKDTVSRSKCAYYKHFKSNYDTETVFEDYLEGLDNVLYWIKNADSGEGISIVYEYNNIKHEFYPDYVVRFVGEKPTIGLYEVKHINDEEKDTITKAKIEKLKDYCMEHGYKCGKIEIKDNKVYLPTIPRELR